MESIMLLNAPENWKVYRLGQLLEERKEKVSDKDYPPLSVTKDGIVPQMEHVAKSDDSENRKKVLKGDFVINSRSDRKGSSGLSDYDGSVSLINIVLKPRIVSPRFLQYLMKSETFQEEFYRFGHGIHADLWTTRFSELKAIKVALPEPEVQEKIVEFLDVELPKFDQIIEQVGGRESAVRSKPGTLLRLLFEKRSALIALVIKGQLNPSTLKESAEAQSHPVHFERELGT
ncbi:restriction endonuclease subunit S [Rhodobacteraceae bacterium G21628-S1]|nr:restriction endonuclease subunit S [Rhodobacteraceae bacterium G21628-S1]